MVLSLFVVDLVDELFLDEMFVESLPDRQFPLEIVYQEGLQEHPVLDLLELR